MILAAALGVVGAAPVAKLLARLSDAAGRRKPARSAGADVGRLGGLLGVFGYSVMLMAAGSYSPFIYFRF